jgi:hypothetical protein
MTDAPSPTTPATRTDALALVDLAGKAARAYDRPDLAERLDRSRARLTDAAFHVLVVGEFKQGKSTLINALLNAPVCAVDDDVATAVPTFIRYAETPSAEVVWHPEADARDPDADPPPAERSPVTIDAARQLIVDAASPDGRRVGQVEIALPRRLLQGGVVLVDTPGVGGLGSTHTATTIGALPMADAVLFVTDASQELSAAEMDFLRTAMDLCPNVTIVLTKTDFYPAWRQIETLDRGHLATAGLDLRILPVSSALRQAAVAAGDKELNLESGFAPLVTLLTDEIGTRSEQLVAAAAAREVAGIAEQLVAHFDAERSVLADPEAANAVVARLQEAKDRADALRSQLARWQQTLSDGMADLQADIDFDLRQRVRVVLRQGDEAIDDSDPLKTWPEFEPWLYHRIAEDITNNYRYLHHRSNELADRVAGHFELDESGVTIELVGGNAAAVMDQVAVDAEIDVKGMGVGMQMLSGVRGGYYGGLMFTALGGVVGLALGPIAVGAGVLLGRKALKDEKERALAQRRQTAKNAIRKYTDEVTFLAGADSRTMLRRIHRQLRDHFTSRAEELQRSTTEALQASQQAAQRDQADRKARLGDVEAELRRVTQLRDRAVSIAGGVS